MKVWSLFLTFWRESLHPLLQWVIIASHNTFVVLMIKRSFEMYPAKKLNETHCFIVDQRNSVACWNAIFKHVDDARDFFFLAFHTRPNKKSKSNGCAVLECHRNEIYANRFFCARWWWWTRLISFCKLG